MPSTVERQQQEQEVTNELRRLRVNLNESQTQTLISFFKSNPSCTVPVALQFCYARKFDLVRTQTLFNNYMDAVEKNGLSKVTVEDVMEELKTVKMYCPEGRDKEGAALFVICARNHKSRQFSMESTIKLAFYLAELVTSHPKTQRNGITLICDLENVEWTQFDPIFFRKIINFFQNNIPCSIKHILLYKPSWWINMLLKMVNPFLKEKMRQRIKICNNVDDLKEVVDVNQLPEQLGGKAIYDHDYFIKNELSKVSKMFPAKSMRTKEEREEVERALFKPPNNVMYLVDNKSTRDVLLNERRKRLEKLDTITTEEKIRSTSPDVLLNMLRSIEGRKRLDVGLTLYYLERPYLMNNQSNDSERQKNKDIKTADAVEESRKAGQDDQSERKFSRRVSQGLQIKSTIDFEEEALKLDKQRHTN